MAVRMRKVPARSLVFECVICFYYCFYFTDGVSRAFFRATVGEFAGRMERNFKCGGGGGFPLFNVSPREV